MSSHTDLHIIVRPATAKDDAAAGELLVEAFVVQYGKKMPEVVVTEARKSDLRAVAERREVGRVLVAEVEGALAGTTTVFPPGHPSSRTKDRTAAEMRYMAVGLGFVGTGVASRLLAAAEAEAKRYGATALALHVRRGAIGVGRFYEKHGYQRAVADDCDLPDIFLEGYRKDLR